ncbi:MAG: (d)CMP kinase [Amylibacter sp.]|nr:(d)CMP kinase [Amylibacter sp.]
MSYVVAIDGPAAAGKGTVSKAVAEHFGFAHLDTGLLYRVVGRVALENVGPSLDEAEVVSLLTKVTEADLKRDDLRTAAVAQAASKVAVIPEVRSALIDFQRKFAARAGGAVLDGRDIGTVICPGADVKLFVTAVAEVRAQRRYEELLGRGEKTAYETVLENVKVRDARDSERAVAPLVAAEDAITIDTSEMSIKTAINVAIAAINP